MKDVRVTPAILTDDPATLREMMSLTETFTDLVHMDIMDGNFVPTKSISAADIAAVPTTLRWKAHLMVKNPVDYLAAFKEAGAQLITFHVESFENPADARYVIAAAREMRLGVGLAVNPDTELPDFLPLADEVDSVLFMSVHPGYYGADFVPEVLRKLMDFRKTARGIFTSIDGGVKEHNIGIIARTGVDEICVGSAVFAQPDPAASYRRLVALAKSGALPSE
jgi:ribulose-phosphate 3-epimerase